MVKKEPDVLFTVEPDILFTVDTNACHVISLGTLTIRIVQTDSMHSKGFSSFTFVYWSLLVHVRYAHDQARFQFILSNHDGPIRRHLSMCVRVRDFSHQFVIV